MGELEELDLGEKDFSGNRDTLELKGVQLSYGEWFKEGEDLIQKYGSRFEGHGFLEILD